MVQWEKDVKLLGDIQVGHSFRLSELVRDPSKPWYMHYNPKNPKILPVNALELYILLDLRQLMGGSKLFRDSPYYKRYTEVLIELITYPKEKLSSHGKVENLGSPSL